jgi:hypothetical protein
MAKFIRASNVILNAEKILYLIDEDGMVKVYFEGGQVLNFVGDAAEVWKLFDDDKDWRDDSQSNL